MRAAQPADTRGVQAELLSRGLSVKYVCSTVAGCWRAFLRDAAEDGVVSLSVYPHLTWPEWDFPEADPFTSDQRGAVLDWFRTHRLRCFAPWTQTGYDSRPYLATVSRRRAFVVLVGPAAVRGNGPA